MERIVLTHAVDTVGLVLHATEKTERAQHACRDGKINFATRVCKTFKMFFKVNDD